MVVDDGICAPTSVDRVLRPKVLIDIALDRTGMAPGECEHEQRRALSVSCAAEEADDSRKPGQCLSGIFDMFGDRPGARAAGSLLGEMEQPGIH